MLKLWLTIDQFMIRTNCQPSWSSLSPRNERKLMKSLIAHLKLKIEKLKIQ